MKVELVKIPTEITDENIKQYLADCSSVVRDKQPKDNEKLFKRLLKESFGNKASRVFEYIPCIVPHTINHLNSKQLFGFYADVFEFRGHVYHTTARELLDWGWDWRTEILPYIDFTNYKAVKITAPYFIYGQMSTHTQITSVSHSNRYTQSTLGYWYPPSFIGKCDVRYIEEVQNQWNQLVREGSPKYLEGYMKETLGIKRREVYARGSDMLEYRVSTLGGYTNNPNAWEHFINQRANDPHTQLETKELAKEMEKLIYAK